MRRIITSLVITLATAGIAQPFPAARYAPPTASKQICGKVACIVAPPLEQRLALVAFLTGRPTAEAACDSVTGARRTGCVVLESLGADARRAARFAAMSKAWTPSQRALFAELLAAEQAFAEAVGENENDHIAAESGIDTIAARQSEHAAFVWTLEWVAGGTRLRPGLVTFAPTDSALNAAYRQVMATPDTGDLGWGTVDKLGIRQTQRAWLAYRTAFVAFAATLDADIDALKSELTQRRTVSLQGFLAD